MATDTSFAARGILNGSPKQEAVKAEVELRERGSPSAKSQTGEAVFDKGDDSIARAVKLGEVASGQSSDRYSAPVAEPAPRGGKAKPVNVADFEYAGAAALKMCKPNE